MNLDLLMKILGWIALLSIFGCICLCCRVIAIWLVSVLNRNRERQ